MKENEVWRRRCGIEQQTHANDERPLPLQAAGIFALNKDGSASGRFVALKVIGEA